MVRGVDLSGLNRDIYFTEATPILYQALRIPFEADGKRPVSAACFQTSACVGGMSA